MTICSFIMAGGKNVMFFAARLAFLYNYYHTMKVGQKTCAF